MKKQVKVTWEWSSGKKAHAWVPVGILAAFVKLLANDNRTYAIRVEGMTYQAYLALRGGEVVERSEVAYPEALA